MREGEAAALRITADSRYTVYVNGRYTGFGPVRSWPNHWKYDDYDLSPRLRAGRNVVAVLVNYWGESNFQYIAAGAPGLAAEIRILSGSGHKAGVEHERIVPVDRNWRTRVSGSCLSRTPRISAQQAYEEQFDAREEDEWMSVDYDDRSWSRARKVPPVYSNLEPRGIPFLTREEVLPVRLVESETIRPVENCWTLNLKPYLAPGDRSANFCYFKSYLFTRIWSSRKQKAGFLRPHHHSAPILVNGVTVPKLPSGSAVRTRFQEAVLLKGWNTVLLPFSAFYKGRLSGAAGGAGHMCQFTLAVKAAGTLFWSARPGTQRSAAWALVGPFALTEQEAAQLEETKDYPRIVLATGVRKAATARRFNEIWRDPGSLTGRESYFRPIREADVAVDDVFTRSLADRPAGPAKVENGDALLAANGEAAVIHPSRRKGEDVRVLLDFGREVIGFQSLEAEAAAGTVLDFHNFEFIQADGRKNLAEGMNNSFRYVCRDGWQSFESRVRRGFQYTWVTVRNLRRPMKLRRCSVIFSTYPQRNTGSFYCSDPMLNRIWEVGAHTLRCCAEDTYTDCPTYEQTHWVGDARNEALIDWVINGDPRLWYRCLEQTAQSLEHSPITESEVPSGWNNILSVWSFLWMRSCREYLLWTGDYAGSRKLLPWVKRNADGIRRYLNPQGLFDLQAWNLFDWAAMDTPPRGIVTHTNCFVVLALREAAELADWLKDAKTATEFRRLASSVKEAINRDLWDNQKQAYLDCIHDDGTKSEVFSQQTQTAALISGVAGGAREKRCRGIVHRPPRGFVRAGSPFFEFFLLETLADEGREREFLDIIRRDWGFMIEEEASTFWEMWSLSQGRLTRSHCHGWSAAPVFFLSSTVLGVRPTRPGFAEIEFKPRPGDLKFMRGRVPTPRGVIEVSGRRKGDRWQPEIRVPKGVRIRKAAARAE